METIELKKDEVALIFNGNELKIKGDIETASGTALYAFVHRTIHDTKWVEDQKQYVKNHFPTIQKEVETRSKEQSKKRVQEQLLAMEESLAKMELTHEMLQCLPRIQRDVVHAELKESAKEIEAYKNTLRSAKQRWELGTITEVGFLGLRFLLESLASVVTDTFGKIIAKLDAYHTQKWNQWEPAYA